MRQITRELELPIAPGAIFGLLVRPSAVRAWWSASRVIVVPKPGGLWAAAWGEDEDSPDFVTAARLAVYDPPRRLALADFTYVSKGSEPLPFASELVTEFEVRPTKNGGVLKVTQRGFPDPPVGDDYFAGCEEGWTATLDGIQRFVSGD